MKKYWLIYVLLLSIVILTSCDYPNNKLAIDLGKERAERHLNDPIFKRVYLIEEMNSSDDAFHSYVCGNVDFKDMHDNYYGFPLRFFVKVDVTKNGAITDTETSNFTIEPLTDKEWFEKQWETNCKQ